MRDPRSARRASTQSRSPRILGLRRNCAADTLGLAPLPAPRRPDDDQPYTPTIDVTGALCHAGGLPPDAEPGRARVNITHGDVIAAVRRRPVAGCSAVAYARLQRHPS